MKRAITLAVCLSLILVHGYSQSESDTIDPFQGNYILNKSAELVLQYATESGYLSRSIYDNVNDNLSQVTKENPLVSTISGNNEMAVATGDIDGDYADEVISCWETDDHSIVISTPGISTSSLGFEGGSTITINSVLKSSMRMITGNFDHDPKEEIVLAYHGLDDHLHIILYQTDENDLLEKTTEIADMPVSGYLPVAPLWVSVDTNFIYDIAAGDFDDDGSDELVAINVLSSRSGKIQSMVHVYDFDSGAENFILTKAKEIENDCYSDPNIIITELAVTTGDFDGNGFDEVAYAFEGVSIPSISSYRNAARGSMFEVLSSLDSISDPSDQTYNIDYRSASGTLLTEWHSLSLCSGDLNKDGKDELIGVGCTALSVFRRAEATMDFIQVVNSIDIPAKYDFEGHQLLAVENIDSDSTAWDYSTWLPEIIVGGVASAVVSSPGEAQLFVIKPRLNANNDITEFTLTQTISTGSAADTMSTMVMALGDFNGDGLRLGKPEKISRQSILTPSIILNAPPSHFDILDEQVYDVNFYDDTEASTNYYEESTTTNTSYTQMNKSWGLSSEISGGTSFYGVGVSASFSSNFSQTFSNSQTEINTVSIASRNSANVYDMIYGVSSDFYLFEYPVYFENKFKGRILVSMPVPHFDKNTWKESTSMTPNTYSLNHEPGNLLSYPFYNSVGDLPDYMASGGYYEFPYTELSSTSTPCDYSMTIDKFTSSDIQKEQEFGIQTEVSASGWGCSVSLRGDYSNSSISSHTTSVGDLFSVTFNYDRIDKSIGEVEYEIKPIVYWSKKGALVVDYDVNLTGKWWDDNYGQKPDPAFIMPFRYGPEKGINFENKSKRMMTSDIRYFPYDARPGDTITILTTVRNFSLMDLTDNVKVRFYLGNPENGGGQISALDGTSEFYVSGIESRHFKSFQFEWATPSDMPEKPWIFAVIDPDDEIDEIHSNNNTGFVPLFRTNEYPAMFSSGMNPESEIQNIIQLSNYPNPAQKETTIRFYLKESCGVSLNVYDAQGKLMEQKEVKPGITGINEIRLNVSSYPRGIYFYQLDTGTALIGNKLIVN